MTIGVSAGIISSSRSIVGGISIVDGNGNVGGSSSRSISNKTNSKSRGSNVNLLG